MRRRINVLLVFVLVGTVAALSVVAVLRVRQAAYQMRCASNLRQLAIATHNYHNDYNKLPPGTILNNRLPHEKRFSWIVQMIPYMEGGTSVDLDKAQAWDAGSNIQARIRFHSKGEGPDVVQDCDWKLFRCPMMPAPSADERPSPTHFVGIAGLGFDAPTLSLDDPRAGVFGYDRQCTLKMIVVGDGTSNTMMLAETLTNPGPWTAGGPSTVRGLIPDASPYLGTGAQFTSPHPHEGDYYSLLPRRAINIAFADCSKRTIATSIDPRIFEALATYRGGEFVTGLDD